MDYAMVFTATQLFIKHVFLYPGRVYTGLSIIVTLAVTCPSITCVIVTGAARVVFVLASNKCIMHVS